MQASQLIQKQRPDTLAFHGYLLKESELMVCGLPLKAVLEHIVVNGIFNQKNLEDETAKQRAMERNLRALQRNAPLHSRHAL